MLVTCKRPTKYLSFISSLSSVGNYEYFPIQKAELQMEYIFSAKLLVCGACLPGE